MKVAERKGLVRGVVEIYQDHCGFEPIKVYTYWYRHDEPNLEKVVNDATDAIVHTYSKDKWRFHSAICGTEWREYQG